MELELLFFVTLLMLKATIYHFPFSKLNPEQASTVAHHFVRVFNVSVWHEWTPHTHTEFTEQVFLWSRLTATMA
jgi:hypothetical protein